MVFSIVLSRQPSPALLFFKLIEVETKFPFANSISEFSRSQGQNRKYSLRADDVRSTPESGLKSDIRPCPKSANRGSRDRREAVVRTRPVDAQARSAAHP